MAARSPRAVRVDPGAATDRRAIAGAKQRGASLPQLHVVSFGDDPRTSSLYPLGRVEQSSPPVKAGINHSRWCEVGVPRVSVRDPLSILYEIERYRGSFEILLFLYQEGATSASRLRQRLRPGPGALQRALLHLEEIGAVRHLQAHSFPFTKSYKLSDWGKDLVETPLRTWSSALVR